MAALTQRQISRAKSEAETSLASANSLHEQWMAAVQHNPTGLTQKDIDHLTKAFKNRLLTVKWDCEDLEELVANSGSGPYAAANQSDELREARDFLEKCKSEISISMGQLESFETNKKIFSKHGIKTIATTTTTTTTTTPQTLPDNNNPVASQTTITTTNNATIIQNPLHDNAQYQRLLEAGSNMPESTTRDDDGGELHFDKSQIESSATIFSNALYEHYETEDYLTKGLHASRVFNNLTRPNTDSADVYAGTNENEMILDMLEPEYYQPPAGGAGILAKTKYNLAMRKLFDPDRNKYLGTLVLVLSLPIVLMLILVF